MSHETLLQPNLYELLARYLEKQADAQAVGIATFSGEVTPYEVGSVQPLDPKLAWDEALAVLLYYDATPLQRRQAPPQWSQLVAGHESIVAVAFCVGNFPQLMRNFHAIFSQSNLEGMRPTASRPATVEELIPWVHQVAAKKQFPQMLLALGALRLARHFEDANALIHTHDAEVPVEWRTGWENEKAAIAWHSGRCEDARKIWDALEPTIPVLFNRGMSAVFSGEAETAVTHLNAAVAQLPETSAWHHLGRLYLTLCSLQRKA